MKVLENFAKSYLSVAAFTRRASAAYEGFSDVEIRSRTRGSKELMEEIIPLAAFLKHIENPGTQVRCRYFPGNQNYDAKILISSPSVGISKKRFFVEVTSAISPVEHLKREALTRYGVAWFGDAIYRTGSRRKGNDQLRSTPVTEGIEDIIGKITKMIEEQLKKKANKRIPYPKPCILLVTAKSEWPLSPRAWATVAEDISSAVDRTLFVATFLVEPWKNIVIEV